LLGGFAAFLLGRGIPVIWAIHNTNLDSVSIKKGTRTIVKVCSKLSNILPTRIIYVADESRVVHERFGYSHKKGGDIIPNGFDVSRFKPDVNARKKIRSELKIRSKVQLVGLIARFDPQKDHENFLIAAGILHQILPKVQFLLCGDNINSCNRQLVSWLEKYGLRNCFHLLGRRDDMPKVISAFDVSASSSMGEAFPLVIGESMSCGIPCVVTDVGDSKRLVGDTGIVVPSKSPELLALGLERMLKMPELERINLGKLARERIERKFSLLSVVQSYEMLYKKILLQKRGLCK